MKSEIVTTVKKQHFILLSDKTVRILRNYTLCKGVVAAKLHDMQPCGYCKTTCLVTICLLQNYMLCNRVVTTKLHVM